MPFGQIQDHCLQYHLSQSGILISQKKFHFFRGAIAFFVQSSLYREMGQLISRGLAEQNICVCLRGSAANL